VTVSGEAIALIITGLGSFIGIALAGAKALRDGSSARQRNLMVDLEEARDRADHDRMQEAQLRRYWERQCHRILEAQRRGIEPPDPEPPIWVDFEAKKKR
jgi:hypothetical protein